MICVLISVSCLGNLQRIAFSLGGGKSFEVILLVLVLSAENRKFPCLCFRLVQNEC